MSEGVSYAGEFIIQKCEIIACGDDRVDVEEEVAVQRPRLGVEDLDPALLLDDEES